MNNTRRKLIAALCMLFLVGLAAVGALSFVRSIPTPPPVVEEPEATEEPTPSSTPTPSSMPTPFSTPTPSSTPTSSPTPTLSFSPTPTQTPEATAEPTEESTPAPTSNPLGVCLEQAQKQAEIDAALLATFAEGGYTWDSPFVQVDPYGCSPLTALVYFTTDEPVSVQIRVIGDTPLADVSFTFEELTTTHQIPVYGLYAKRLNRVELTATNDEGVSRTKIIEVQTEELPTLGSDICIVSQVLKPEEYQPGLNFSYRSVKSSNKKMAFDANGDVRWFLVETGLTIDTLYSFDEKGFFICKGQYYYGDTVIEEINPLGKILNMYSTPSGAHHDLIITDRNSLIVTGSANEENALSLLTEISLVNGEKIQELDYSTILDRSRQMSFSHSEKDWLHMNSVEEYQGDLIVSLNFQSLVMRNSWDGTIKWMLGDPQGYHAMYNKYFLTPIGDDFEWSYNQHDASILPDADNNPDTVDIMLFDNGSSREIFNGAGAGYYTRIVIYRINEKEMTVEQLWSFGKDHPELYSPWRGVAQALANGNALGYFDLSSDDLNIDSAAYVEVNKDGEIVWEAIGQEFSGNLYRDYRVTRHPVYTENALNLHLGEACGVYYQKDMLERNELDESVLSADRTFGDGTTASVAVATPTEMPDTTAEPAADAASDTESMWSIAVSSISTFEEMHASEEVTLYSGDVTTQNYDAYPSAGMQFAVVSLKVNKEHAGSAVLKWADVQLVLADGSTYSRMEDDSFLNNQGYDRLSGTDLRIGSKEGVIAFEIPQTASVEGASLSYDGNLYDIP